VRKEVFYTILTEFGIPVKLDGLIKMFLNEPVVKSVRYISCSEGSETRRYCFTIAFQLLFRIFHREGTRKSGRTGTE
jgi:hypothetical protein